MSKECYEAPRAELFQLKGRSHSLLVHFSIEYGYDDWEDGAPLDNGSSYSDWGSGAPL